MVEGGRTASRNKSPQGQASRPKSKNFFISLDKGGGSWVSMVAGVLYTDFFFELLYPKNCESATSAAITFILCSPFFFLTYS